ncbi:MFS transporter [Gaetbulibacter aestuarii]|uniref:MFS transporter n=1 Tax=Gaetbulibacter aestuarii TaxID=1502358 RepID=A0ABW7MZV0_9FLAO
MGSLRVIFSNIRYFSITWLFASVNLMVGTWVLYIPHIKERLALNDAQIGIALFCLSLGVLLFIPIVPWFSKHVGLGKTSFFAVILFSAAYILPFFVSSFILLCSALFVVGIFLGITDVTMNALVSVTEKRDVSHFMSAAHGFFSLGGAVGAIIGSLLMPFFTNPMYHMACMALLIIVTNLVLQKYYFKVTEDSHHEEQSSFPFKLLKPLFVVAFLTFVIMGSEGSIEHWSTLYLVEVLEVAKDNQIGLGFILFSTCMTIGRFFGDAVSEKLGSLKIIFWGIFIAVFAFVAILSRQFYISLFGFALLGIGLSVIIPELFRIAGNTKNISSSRGISFVSGLGFLGFLLGPVGLGFISKQFSLWASFLFLLCMVTVALIIAFFKMRKA